MSSTRQRRSPGSEGGPPQMPVPNRSQSPGGSLSSSSRPTGSSRSRSQAGSGGGGRPSTSGGTSSTLSQIEKSVTHLLVATKQLLETLTKWSRGTATDGNVSDVYVRLGYEFNMACRAFNAINVDTSDLGNVPDELRNILEATLSQEASTESLERYLPRIRDIIINLLHGLKRKQQRLRQRQSRSQVGERDSTDSGGPTMNTPERVVSIPGSQGGKILKEIDDMQRRYDPRRPESNVVRQRETTPGSDYPANGNNGMAGGPPYPSNGAPSGDLPLDSFPPPPPPPVQQQAQQQGTPADALAKLQREGVLERRASRRYSQYQISKVLNSQEVPMMPRDAANYSRAESDRLEAVEAITKRNSKRISRMPPTPNRAAFDISPTGTPDKFAEKNREIPTEVSTPSRGNNGVTNGANGSGERNGSISRPRPPRPADMTVVPEEKSPSMLDGTNPRTPDKARLDAPFSEPGSPKDLTLFLQYKNKVKKFVLPEGDKDLTLGRLQLAFIEKFSWNTHHNGVDLPDIYIQDSVSGIRHELEDLSDISDRSVLVLNVEPLDEVKRHIDEGLGGLRKLVEQVKESVATQGAALTRVSEKQQETVSEVNRLASAPPQTIIQQGPSVGRGGPKLGAADLSEIRVLRRDLAVLRQTYSDFQSGMEAAMAGVRSKAAGVKGLAGKTIVAGTEGDAGYSYVTNGRKKLNSDSDRIVGQVDDLQDLVEDLRKDVVNRGVRPLPRQLETVTKEIGMIQKELGLMEDYLKVERPIWTKIWEKELEEVCQGRDELRLMEDLLVDLKDDLQKAAETFSLVEQATKEQMKDTGAGVSAGSVRTFSKGLNHLGNSLDQNAAKDGVLGEVRALNPNHEDRVEAIERARKLREKDLEGRMTNKLQKEIEGFNERGGLKKSGGFEEVERNRKAAEERVRREVWGAVGGVLDEVPEEDLEDTEKGPGEPDEKKELTMSEDVPGGEEFDEEEDMDDFIIMPDGTVVPK